MAREREKALPVGCGRPLIRCCVSVIVVVCVCVCGRVIVRVRGRERRVRRKERGFLDKECVVGDGYIAKYLVRKFTKIPPT
jgi:hypothetical protein